MAKKNLAEPAPRSAQPKAVVGATVRQQSPLRVLIASHSHPQLSKGGAEIAAYELYRVLSERPGYEAWFIGCGRDAAQQKLGATISQPFSEREYLYAAGAFDWFHFANRDPKFPDEFRDFLQRLKPDIVHFHHYLNFGVEAIQHVRDVLPACKVAVTLHEYLALCHHYGQMITTETHTLCHASTPLRCSKCFKDIPPSDFFLRNLYIKRFFDGVDGFIAPSEFLAERYAGWGIPRERLTVIENMIPPGRLALPAEGRKNDRSTLLRVGFFGQISSLKGINVLFDTADLMMERKIDHIVFEIYGDYRGQPSEFQEDFRQRLAKAGRNVKFHGPYDQSRVDALMRPLDLILVPSIWWENSPVVIQEALRNRRAVVCSDIGGMAEKIRDGIDGFHFPVGNSLALAALLLKLSKKGELIAGVEKTLCDVPTVAAMADRYDRYYTAVASG